MRKLEGNGLLGRQAAADPHFGLLCLSLTNLEIDNLAREASRCSCREEEATDIMEIREESWNSQEKTGCKHIVQILSLCLFSPSMEQDCSRRQHYCQVSASHSIPFWSFRTKHSRSSNGISCDLILCSSNSSSSRHWSLELVDGPYSDSDLLTLLLHSPSKDSPNG